MRNKVSFQFRSARVRLACLLLVLAWILCSAGCSKSVDVEYGKRRGMRGETSLNGTMAFSNMLTQAGHKVNSRTRLSSRMWQQAEVIVWFINDDEPPSAEARDWLEDWLLNSPNRTLIFVGRDYDAAIRYWDGIDDQVSATQKKEIDDLKQRVTFYRDFQRDQAEKFFGKDQRWFTLKAGVYRAIDKVEGSQHFIEGVQAEKAELEITTRLVPPDDADILLKSGGDILVTSQEYDRSRLLTVANASFLLNYSLINHEHRKLASKLVGELGTKPQQVYFLESDAHPRIIKEEEKEASAWALLKYRPICAFLLFVCLGGMVFILSKFPIFGRAKTSNPTWQTDFGSHLAALGDLLEKYAGAPFSRSKLIQYHQSLRKRDSKKLPLD